MQGYIFLAIIGSEQISVTEVDKRTKCQIDGWTEIQTHISHPAISRCDNNT